MAETLPFWADPNTPETMVRQLLEQQVKENESLRRELKETQDKLKSAEQIVRELQSSAQGGTSEAARVAQQLESQVKMRDSIITCLQQELAVVKAEKSTSVRQDEEERTEALETHLMRAKARSQAISDQYATMIAEESARIQRAVNVNYIGGER